jgi:hypothetical protein
VNARVDPLIKWSSSGVSMPPSTIEGSIMINATRNDRTTLGEVGKVNAETLARWALVRQIAELEETLADVHHSDDPDPASVWIERAYALLAEKRTALNRR